MTPLKISGATARLAGGSEEVRPLFVRQVDDCLVSRWEPTQKELDTLFDGGSVEVWVQGNSHPPLYIGVAPLEEGL